MTFNLLSKNGFILKYYLLILFPGIYFSMGGVISSVLKNVRAGA